MGVTHMITCRTGQCKSDTNHTHQNTTKNRHSARAVRTVHATTTKKWSVTSVPSVTMGEAPMTVYKCAADGCYNQVGERGARCDQHTGVEYVSAEDYARLAQLLSPAELRDYIGVEVHGNGVREWARKVEKPHQNVSRNHRSARETLSDQREQ